MSQTVYFDAGTYNISFEATQRIEYNTENQQIEVLIDPGQADAQVAGLITPVVSITPNSSKSNPTYLYSLYQNVEFHGHGRRSTPSSSSAWPR